jgi:hypothetical protein
MLITYNKNYFHKHILDEVRQEKIGRLALTLKVIY